ncbi:salivary protein Tsal1-like [Cochliomyia hominivorax]
MLLKLIIKILIFISQISDILTQTCNIDYDHDGWLDEWRLILITDHTNTYQLLRDNKVPICRQISLICRGQQTNVRCLTNQQFDRALPLVPPCPEARAVQSVMHTQRYSYCPHTLYEIGYEISYGEKDYFLETYKVCFDEKHLRPIFSINMAYPKGGDRPEDFRFEYDDIFGNNFYAFTRRNTFNRFKRLLGENQEYMDEHNVNHIINRGHLTPSADFALTNLKYSTFRLINAIPQFKTIDSGNWRNIEEWARHPSRTPAKICTGVLNCNLDSVLPTGLDCVLKLQNAQRRWVPMFLANQRKIPIPLWIYKIVNYKGMGKVFLVLNNIYHEGNVNHPNGCNVEECPSDLKLGYRAEKGFTFCCEYNHFIRTHVPLLKDLC